MVHKHVAALLDPLAIGQRSDEPKSGLVIEPLHAAGEPGPRVRGTNHIGRLVVVVVGCTHGCFRCDNTSCDVFKCVFRISCLLCNNYAHAVKRENKNIYQKQKQTQSIYVALASSASAHHNYKFRK